jgi:hypothetical protein
MANEFDIFNLSIEDIDNFQKNEKGSDLYKPTADQGKDGIYNSLIRFIPNPKNPQKSIIRKFVYWLEDSEGKGNYFDSPSTIGEKCPVQDLFFKLRNSESAVDKKMSERLKRREVYYSLIQIVKDFQNPEMEGSIKVFKYGYQIKQKIDEELNPQYDEPCQVFDLFEGKNFELKINKTAGYNSFTASKFQGKRTPININGENMQNGDDDRKKIMAYLKDIPDLLSFDYKSWDDSTRNSVEKILNNYRSPGTAIKNITIDKVVHDDVEEFKKPQSNDFLSVEKAKEDSDDLDDFLNGLDL